MNYDIVLPIPLRHKIAGWNLPAFVELTLLEELQNRIGDDSLTRDESVVRSLELSACDPVMGDVHRFYIQYTVRVHRDVIGILDLNVEYLPPD